MIVKSFSISENAGIFSKGWAFTRFKSNAEPNPYIMTEHRIRRIEMIDTLK